MAYEQLLKFVNAGGCAHKRRVQWKMFGNAQLYGSWLSLVYPTFRSYHGLGDEEFLRIVYSRLSAIGETLLHLGVLLFVCHSEHPVCDKEVKICASFEEGQAVVVHLADTVLVKLTFPSTIVSASTGIEVP
ncbi:hypothetical protein CHS0354_031239, partial [Potamilus streckersoni]